MPIPLKSIVGMLAIKWENDAPRYTFKVHSKVNDEYFLLQAMSAMDGSFNTLKAVHVSKLAELCFYENAESYNYTYDDWERHKKNRFDFNL